MNIAIIGFDTEGRASYDYFISRPEQHTITIRDQNAELVVPDGVDSVLGEHYLDDLDRFDLIVRTAGLHPRKILDKNPDVAGRITTHINEFFKASPTTNIIGVTGTKGKGTTSSLITAMLEELTQSGKPFGGQIVRLGGNIGLPPLTFIDELDAGAWVVLELSSFQLIDLQASPHVAVCLMVAAEHLDWHTDLEEYLTAKEQLFARQATADVAVYYHENPLSTRIAAAGQAMKVPYCYAPGAEVVEAVEVAAAPGEPMDARIVIEGTEICRTGELRLLGRHNWQNACAAVTAVWYACLPEVQRLCGPAEQLDVAALRRAISGFGGLEHRLEPVRELDGVHYYDDSFGTTPETAIVAIQAFAEAKVLVLGGSDKGASYDELARTVAAGNVRHVLLIGEQAGRLQSALDAAGYHAYSPGGDTMHAIVTNLQRLAQPGDVALLSTGCASFGMFRNYKDRGEQFKQAVNRLAAENTGGTKR